MLESDQVESKLFDQFVRWFRQTGSGFSCLSIDLEIGEHNGQQGHFQHPSKAPTPSIHKRSVNSIDRKEEKMQFVWILAFLH